MKVYQKKSINPEEETVLVQLERRHTVKEGPHEENLDENSKQTSRTVSLGHIEESCSSTDSETVVSSGKKSNFTRKPTVITESELSSSWLYKDRKARINSDDESVEDPKPDMAAVEEGENLEPRALQDPNLRPVPVQNHRSVKKTSCCFYLAIILVTCIVSLVILAAIGGVIYMELFADYGDNLDATEVDQTVNDDKNTSASKQNLQQSMHEKDNLRKNETKLPEYILKDTLSNYTPTKLDVALYKELVPTDSHAEDDVFDNEDPTESDGSKDKKINEEQNDYVSEIQDIEKSENAIFDQFAKFSRIMIDRLKQLKLNGSNQSVELDANTERQDPMDLKPSKPSVDHNTEVKSDGYENEENGQKLDNENDITFKKSNSKTEISDSSEQSFVASKNFSSDEITLQYLEPHVNDTISNILFENISKLEERGKHLNDRDRNSSVLNENSIENLSQQENHGKQLKDHDSNSSVNNENSIENLSQQEDHGEQLQDHDRNSSVNENSIENLSQQEHHGENLNNHDLKNNDHNLFDIAENLIGDSNSSSSEEGLLDDKQDLNFNDSAQLVFIRPVVESKAVPVPLTFLRRIGFDIQNPNSHQPMTAQDMDIKFSLSEALKYLRSLDTGNKLPASREKATRQKINRQEETREQKLPSGVESQEYLNNLRRRLFQES